jgi:hypothetical protein
MKMNRKTYGGNLEVWFSSLYSAGGFSNMKKFVPVMCYFP